MQIIILPFCFSVHQISHSSVSTIQALIYATIIILSLLQLIGQKLQWQKTLRPSIDYIVSTVFIISSIFVKGTFTLQVALLIIGYTIFRATSQIALQSYLQLFLKFFQLICLVILLYSIQSQDRWDLILLILVMSCLIFIIVKVEYRSIKDNHEKNDSSKLDSMQMALKYMPIGIFSYDIKNTFRMINKGSERLFAYKTDQEIRDIVLKLPYFKMLDDLDSDHNIEQFCIDQIQVFKQLNEFSISVFSNSQSIAVEQMTTQQNRQIIFYTQMESQFYSVVATNTDIGKNQQMLLMISPIQYQDEMDKYKIQNSNKTKLLYEVTHEFRQPLNCIILMSQRLHENTKDQICEFINQSAQQLLSLCNDILDVAQLSAGTFNLHLCQFSLVKLVNDVKNQLQCVFDQKDLKFITNLSAVDLIYSDPNRIRQILFNLIGNALKFTRSGFISLDVIDHDSDSLEQQIEFIIRDTGCGIKEENKARLFQAFGKLDDTLDQNVQGVGLGLLISNILAKKLGSKPIMIQSDGSTGSTFSFWVRMVRQQRKSSGIKQRSSLQIKYQASLAMNSMEVALDFTLNIQQRLPSNFDIQDQLEICKCKQLLIVDDVYFNLLALRMALESFNLRIDVAQDGYEAIEMINNYPQKCCSQYKLILMDIEMPKISGIETTKIIKKNHNNLIIFGCSAFDLEKTYVDYQMNGYFTKPVEPIKVVSLLNELIQIS